jgi:hypothetical protein
MADLAVAFATAHRRERVLLRHALGTPPLARLLLPRLAAAAPGLFRPASKVAHEISHCLVESADSEGSLEAASLLWGLSEGDAPARADLRRLLAARRPASLLEWHWVHATIGGGDGGARPLPISFAYWGVIQVGRPGAWGRAGNGFLAPRGLGAS